MSEPKGRVLALDLGTVRVGLALSDPLGITAQPFGRIARSLLRRDLSPLREVVEAHGVAAILVGHPRLLSGEAGTRAQEAEAFARKLTAEVSIPVILWDERLTTVQANRALLEGGVKRSRRREVVDAAAATLLLQSWLDADYEGGSSST